jgi:hypothetical protein
MSDDKPLYDIDIKTPVSPDELKRFTDLLENERYVVITDLEYGKIRIAERKPETADEREIESNDDPRHA